MNGEEERGTGRCAHVQREISFRKEMEVEDLKVKLPETLYALGSLGVCTAWRLLGKSTYFLSESI